MKHYKFFPFIILFLVVCLFFYKVFLGLFPFPGDLLVSEYQPWKSYSFLGYNPGSYPSKKQYFDTLRQIYPWRTFVNNELKSGRIPLWNPHNFSGHPLMANLQSQVFYPLTILYLLLSQHMAWTILIILQPFLATIGMFLYLRALSRSIFASLFGSISYGFCLFMTVFLEYNTIGHVILWLPFIIFSIEKMRESRRFTYRLLYVFSLTASFLGGHLQLFGAVFLFQFIYAFYLVKEKKIILELVILMCISIGIAAIQLIPTIELIQYSARSNHEYMDIINRLLVQPKQILTFLNPDLFGNPATGNYVLNDSYPGKALFFGSITFFFALVGFSLRTKERVFSFFSLSFLVGLIFITNTPITQFLYRFPLPLFSQSAPGNFIFILSFTGAALAAYGMDNWSKKQNQLRVPFIITSVMVLSIWVSYLTGKPFLNRTMVFFASGMYVLLIGILLASIISVNKKILSAVIILLTVGELWYSFQKFNPFVPKELIFPETNVTNFIKNLQSSHRFFGYGAATIEANFATQLGLFDPNGYDPLYPEHYGRYIYSSKDGSFPISFDRSSRSDARILEGFGKEPFDTNIHRKKVLDNLNVRYLLNKTENGTTEETFPPALYPIIYNQDGFIIHENIRALPNTHFIPYSASNSATVNVTAYEPTRISMTVASDSKQRLEISDTYMPGWEAFINEKSTPIRQANTAFREIEIPEGTHLITLIYRPKSFLYGGWITFASFISLLIFGIWRRIRQRNYAN